MAFEKPDLKTFIGTNGSHGGRKGENKVDDVRPDGLSYYQSIVAHKGHQDFCTQLGNGILSTNEAQALENAKQKAYTEERIAGRSGRGEKP